MTSLYICYQSILEPLTATQVVAYLEGLVRAGYAIILLTFEPRRLTAEECKDWSARLARKGITWTWLRYHKRPTLPATAWDVFMGVCTGFRLIRKQRVQIVHARSHVPAVMALILAKLTGVRFLFDVRGLMAEEYVDGGVWPAGGLLFRLTKRVERSLIRAADALVVLTRKAQRLLEEWYPCEMAGKTVRVIPCCVDLSNYPMPAAVNGTPSATTLVYVGKLGGWYLTEAMTAFAARALEALPSARWQVLTQSNPAALQPLLAQHAIVDRVDVGRVSPEEVPARLQGARAGLAFIKPCLSKLASSPTKVGEYLAAGVPVVTLAGIGDLDELLGQGDDAVGVIVPGLQDEDFRAAMPRLLAMMRDPEIQMRCRRVAEREFDLQKVGWTRYREVYGALAPQRTDT
jgi:glycosyltransferase involved in cell wall biosynthesis